MKFLVTFLDEGDFRVIASKSKVFTSIIEAIKYCDTVAEERKAHAILVNDAAFASEWVFAQLVKHHQDVVIHRNPELIQPLLRYEFTDNETVCFVKGCDETAFPSKDMTAYCNELERLIAKGH